MPYTDKTPVRVFPYKRALEKKSRLGFSSGQVIRMLPMPKSIWVNGEEISVPEFPGMTLEGSYRVLEHVRMTP